MLRSVGIRQHTPSCPLRAGVVCCLPTCAQGSSATVSVNWEFSAFWDLCGLLGVLCVLVLLVLSLIFTGLGLRRCAFAGHAFLAEVGGGIIYVTLGEFLGSLKKVLLCFTGGGKFLGI